MTIIADVFPKLRTAKDVTEMLIGPVAEDPSTGKMVNGP